jgi:hypothetical protein
MYLHIEFRYALVDEIFNFLKSTRDGGLCQR